jgi:hypothetical protein
MSRKDWTADTLFFRLINNKSERTFYDNLSALRKRATKEVFDRCCLLINTGNDKERYVGVTVLAQLGGMARPFYKPSIKLFFKILPKEKNFDVLFALIYAIGHNNEKITTAEINIIAPFKNNASFRIRKALAFALLCVDNIIAINILIELSADKNTGVRSWATFGLGTQISRKSKSITTALWNRINDKDQETRFEAIVGLAKRKDPRIKDIIKREISADIYGHLIFRAITELGDLEFLPILEQLQKESINDQTISRHWLYELNDSIEELREKSLI